MAKQVELSVRRVVKGYHECPFEVNVGEIFYAFKKRGQRGNAFRVTNDRGSSAIFNRVTLKRLKDNFVLVSRRSESSNLSELLIVIRGKNATNLT